MRLTNSLILALATFSAGTANAFDINPFKKYDGSRQLEVDMEKGAGVVSTIIANPVHEEITLRTLFTIRDNKLPGHGRINDAMIKDVINGIRWNDDPLHLLPDHPYEWLLNFEHASNIDKRLTSNFDLFYRSHHHDLQFLHSMASSDSETASQTRMKVLSWLEFTYKVATGAIPINTPFNQLTHLLSRPASRVFKKYFLANGRRQGWTPAYLFGLRCMREVELPDHYGNLDCRQTSWLQNKVTIQNIALGSFLHVIQDSFSDSHVTRNPQHDERISYIYGRSAVVTFNAYNKQSFNLHRGADSYPKDFDLESGVKTTGYDLIPKSVVLASKILSDRGHRRTDSTWTKVMVELKNGLFKLLDGNALAGSGKYK